MQYSSFGSMHSWKSQIRTPEKTKSYIGSQPKFCLMTFAWDIAEISPFMTLMKEQHIVLINRTGQMDASLLQLQSRLERGLYPIWLFLTSHDGFISIRIDSHRSLTHMPLTWTSCDGWVSVRAYHQSSVAIDIIDMLNMWMCLVDLDLSFYILQNKDKN